MSNINILHVIDTLGIGGAEKLLVGTINALSNCNHHVIYLCGKDKLASELPANCRITRLNFHSKWDVPRCVLAIRRYIKENNIEIVHSHLVMSNLISRLATPRKVKIVEYCVGYRDQNMSLFVKKFFHP